MQQQSDIVIIGGGLAGLTASIHLKTLGFSVTLVERDVYPKHKVCGEYISNEVKPYLDYLHLDIESLHTVDINTLHISTQSGKLLRTGLKLGGFGISRYTLDNYLYKVAGERGVNLIQDAVTQNHIQPDGSISTTLSGREIKGKIVIGAHGKRSLIDKKLDRSFISKKSPWLGVKMHYTGRLKSNVVELHNFKGGYCGISMVEDHKINVCYLVKYESFKAYKDIQLFQEKVLFQNKHLQTFFETVTPILESPLTISQINFDKKLPVEKDIFMVGDAAGLIHPLCGNGMAMAMNSSRLLCTLLYKHKDNLITNKTIIANEYAKLWKTAFSSRLKYSRLLQHILLDKNSQEIAFFIGKTFPLILPQIIKHTHGNPMIC